MPITSSDQQAQDESSFRNILIEAWVATKMERDKSILAVSSAGIGLLVTLSLAFSPLFDDQALAVVVGLFAFLVSILLVVFIFNGNGDHLMKCITDNTFKDTDPHLERLDRYAQRAFIIGILAILYVGVSVHFKHQNPEVASYEQVNEKQER